MLYRQKSDVFIRIYGDVGYITNQSNYADLVTEGSGTVFLKALSRTPKNLETLTTEIAASFIHVDRAQLRQDIIEYYDIFEQDGFIVSGHTESELLAKDTGFSYSIFEQGTYKKDSYPTILRAQKSTQEYLEEQFKEKPRLMSFQVELTSKCNERCVHCYIPHENKITDIESDLFYNVLEQYKEIGGLSLNISGGEPMLHKNFCDFLRKTNEYDFSITILSNLTLLNDEIITELKKCHHAAISVSLYSMNPVIHDSITQLKGSFYKTRGNILKLIENDIPLQISCPTMKQNKDCYADVLNWAYDHRCKVSTDYLLLSRYDHTRDNLNNRLSLEEVKKILNDILQNDPEYQKEIYREDLEEWDNIDRSDDIVCGVCSSAICMVANGNVYPCAGWQDFVLGNLYKETLQDIWENAPRVKYLRSLRKKDFPKCLTCSDKAFCAMCMARNYNESPDGDIFFINEYFCKAAAINKKTVLEWKEKKQKEIDPI